MKAIQAKKEAGLNFQRRPELQITRIYNAIQSAVNNGEFRVLIYEDLEHFEKNCLKEDGYRFEEFSLGLTGVWVCEIKW